MRYLLPLLFSLAGMASAHAMDTTTQGLVISAYATSQVTTAPFDRKLVREAGTMPRYSSPPMARSAVLGWKLPWNHYAIIAHGRALAIWNWRKQFSSNDYI